MKECVFARVLKVLLAIYFISVVAAERRTKTSHIYPNLNTPNNTTAVTKGAIMHAVINVGGMNNLLVLEKHYTSIQVLIHFFTRLF